MNNDNNSRSENLEKKREYKGTTMLIESDAYNLVRQKQNEMFEKTKKIIALQDIASKAIEKGIELVSFE